jgi:Ser-tRNA(Ala) deacylase AlaX
MRATKRLYWEDDHAYSATATVVGVREDAVAFDQTCFYPGGGGQPPDCGTVELDGAASRVNDVKSDANGVLWHCCDSPDPAWQGRAAVLHIDELRRVMLSRYHTVLHLVNTIALRNYGAWITGAQIDVDYARIDFKWEGFSPSLCSDIETKVNAEIATARSIRGYLLANNGLPTVRNSSGRLKNVRR